MCEYDSLPRLCTPQWAYIECELGVHLISFDMQTMRSVISALGAGAAECRSSADSLARSSIIPYYFPTFVVSCMYHTGRGSEGLVAIRAVAIPELVFR